MTKIYNNLEALAAAEGETAYRFCLLLTGQTRKAEQAAFQAFLYMSEEAGPLDEAAERSRLYRWAYRAAEDEWFRKSSAPLRRAVFEDLLGAPVSDRLWRFMKRPLKRKAAFLLVRDAGLTPEAAAGILRLRRGRLERRLAAEETEALCAELRALAPPPMWSEQLGDDLLMRCEERNVPLENRLLRIRSAADRLVPLLALAALLLCAAAVWYTGRAAALPS